MRKNLVFFIICIFIFWSFIMPLLYHSEDIKSEERKFKSYHMPVHNSVNNSYNRMPGTENIFSPSYRLDLPGLVASRTTVGRSRDQYNVYGGYDIGVIKNGTIYVVWGANASGEYVIYFGKSYDGGFTLCDIVQVSDKGAWGDRGYPKLAVSSDGKYVYVAWTDLRNDPDGKFTTGTTNDRQDIYFSMSTDYGRTFEPDVKLNMDGELNHNGIEDIACDDNGTVYVLYYGCRQGITDNLYLRCSYDYGETFEEERLIAYNCGGDVEIDPKNSSWIYIALVDGREDYDGDITFAYSHDGGRTFIEKKLSVDESGTLGKQTYVHLEITDNGTIFVMWLLDDMILRYRVSYDGGITFTEIITLWVPPRSVYIWYCALTQENNIIYASWILRDIPSDYVYLTSINLSQPKEHPVTNVSYFLDEKSSVRKKRIELVVKNQRINIYWYLIMQNNSFVSDEALYFSTNKFPNTPPTLSDINCTPLEGNADTHFNFTVKIRDTHNDTIADGYPRLYLYRDAEGKEPIAEASGIVMRPLDNQNQDYIRGVTFYANVSLPYGGGDYYYRIYALASRGNMTIVHTRVLKGPHIDAEDVFFSDYYPIGWINESYIEYSNLGGFIKVGISIYDNDSGVDRHSIRYRVIGGKGNSNLYNWTSLYLQYYYLDDRNISAYVYLNLSKARDASVQWMAYDLAGNGPFYSRIYPIKMDFDDVYYVNASPVNVWVNTTDIIFHVDICDNTSGVNGSSIYYAVLRGNDTGGVRWMRLGINYSANIIPLDLELKLSEGENIVLFKAYDEVWHGYNKTAGYTIYVDATPPEFTTPLPPNITVGNSTVIDIGVIDAWSGLARLEYRIDDGDWIVFGVYNGSDEEHTALNITAVLGTNLTNITNLSRLYLRVFDLGGNAAYYGPITLIYSPYENITQGMKDSDNDGWNDTIEILCGTDPKDNTSYPSDLDNDGIPDAIDSDIDGDGVPNDEDAYPYDKTRWQDGGNRTEPKAAPNKYYAVASAVGLLVAIFIAGIYVSYRKKNPR